MFVCSQWNVHELGDVKRSSNWVFYVIIRFTARNVSSKLVSALICRCREMYYHPSLPVAIYLPSRWFHNLQISSKQMLNCKYIHCSSRKITYILNYSTLERTSNKLLAIKIATSQIDNFVSSLTFDSFAIKLYVGNRRIKKNQFGTLQFQFYIHYYWTMNNFKFNFGTEIQESLERSHLHGEI